MASQKSFLKDVVEKLEQAGIDYVICGSIAASFYGVERSTQDTDIIIDPTEDQIIKFIELIGAAYYVSRQAALDALRQHDMFNVIDIENAWKADLIIKQQTDYGIEEFHRKRKKGLLGKELHILSPEDTILSKLLWAQKSCSELQHRDVMTILDVQAGSLDMKYLNKWSKILDVEDDLNKCLSEIQDFR